MIRCDFCEEEASDFGAILRDDGPLFRAVCASYLCKWKNLNGASCWIELDKDEFVIRQALET